MRLRNALKIAIANYALVLKNLIYKIIVIAICSLSLGLILKLALRPFIEELRPVLKSLWGVVVAIVNGENHEASITLFKDAFLVFRAYLSDNVGGLVWMAIIILLFGIAYRFLIGISDCTLMILVNGHMTDMSHRGYVVVMIENLKKILIYQLIDAVSSVLWSTLVCVVAWSIFRLTVLIMPMASLFAIGFTISFAMSFYCTVFSQVMANVLLGEHKSVKRAFLEGIVPKKKYFLKMLSAYFAVTVVLIYLHVSVTLFTFGVGEIILVPFASLLLATMKTVDFFTINKKKYFVDYDTIFVPKELRENDENLLSDVEI